MPNKNQNFDGGGSDTRVRGNVYQVLEKYLQLARDAGVAGDRVAAENFLQHADHYYRVITAMNDGQRPRVGGREISVADVNVQNVSQGLSAALYSGGPSQPNMTAMPATRRRSRATATRVIPTASTAVRTIPMAATSTLAMPMAITARMRMAAMIMAKVMAAVATAIARDNTRNDHGRGDNGRGDNRRNNNQHAGDNQSRHGNATDDQGDDAANGGAKTGAKKGTNMGRNNNAGGRIGKIAGPPGSFLQRGTQWPGEQCTWRRMVDRSGTAGSTGPSLGPNTRPLCRPRPMTSSRPMTNSADESGALRCRRQRCSAETPADGARAPAGRRAAVSAPVAPARAAKAMAKRLRKRSPPATEGSE